MGKDSELAATLAQRKPVIAYVPAVDVRSHSRKISHYPLEFFRKRYLSLKAEGVLDDPVCAGSLDGIDDRYEKTLDEFIRTLTSYRAEQPFTLWQRKEDQFKSGCQAFRTVCQLIATADRFSYENRANNLVRLHPLAIQVDLSSGVANGVLVVRDPTTCARLLERILTNSMRLRAEPDRDDPRGTVLRERLSESRFRVVTGDARLTNTFWNFYLTSRNY